MFKSILVAATLSVISTAGYAATLFENTAVTTLAGDCTFECINGVGGENFSLATAATVTDFTFDVFHTASNDISGTTIDWALHSDATGLPGTSLLNGTSALSYQNLGTSGSYDRLRVAVDIADTAFSAGDYWLSLTLTVPNSSYSLFWIPSSDGDALSAQSADGGVTWTTPYASFATGAAFAINGTGVAAVPLPAGLPLLLAGLGAMAVVRRKKA